MSQVISPIAPLRAPRLLVALLRPSRVGRGGQVWGDGGSARLGLARPGGAMGAGREAPSRCPELPPPPGREGQPLGRGAGNPAEGRGGLTGVRARRAPLAPPSSPRLPPHEYANMGIIRSQWRARWSHGAGGSSGKRS